MNATQKKLIISWLAGNGMASDRMNAGQGGQSLPPWFYAAMRAFQRHGVTAENFDDKIKTGDPKKIFDSLDKLIERENANTTA